MEYKKKKQEKKKMGKAKRGKGQAKPHRASLHGRARAVGRSVGLALISAV